MNSRSNNVSSKDLQRAAGRLLVTGLLGASLSAPATQTVSSLSDSGPGSLRAAITASALTDTIVFKSGLIGTISLTSGSLIIPTNKNLTITGPGLNKITIAGRIVVDEINGITPGGSASISSLTFSNVGMYNGGRLTVKNCLFNNSEISSDLASAGLSVSSCSFISNSCSGCDAVIENGSAAPATIVNSSFSRGTAGLAIIWQLGTGTLWMTNVTISGNTLQRDAAIHVQQGTVHLEYCTIAGNRSLGLLGAGVGGLDCLGGSASADYHCTIFSDNTPTSLGGSALVSRGHNISSDAAGGDATAGPGGFLNGTADLRNTDPMLAPLGFSSQVPIAHPLLPGSPAIDRGDALNHPATDQLGAARPAVAGCTGTTVPDIGAFEVQRYTVTSNADTGLNTLRYFLQLNNGHGGSDICFSLPNPSTIGVSSLLQIASSVRIVGPGATALIISNTPLCCGTRPIFLVDNGDQANPIIASISGLTLVNATQAAIENTGMLTVSKCSITNNSGGGIVSDGFLGGSLMVKDSLLARNTGSSAVGFSSPCTLANTTVSDNNCTFAAVNAGGPLHLEYCTVAFNTCPGVAAVGAASQATYHGTIVADNTGQQFINANGGTLTSIGYNLSSDLTGNLSAALHDQPGREPLLAPLVNNGGPTKTRALRSGSPAIDSGDPFSFPAADQRGVRRPQGASPDIGAFETNVVGASDLVPVQASVAVGDAITYAFTWTVPEPRNWHDLASLDFLVHDGDDIAILIRFDEASKTFSVFNETTGQFGRGFAAGSPNVLETSQATMHLNESSVLGSGPTGPSVTLNLSLGFKPSTAGHSFAVEVAGTDDFGNRDDFARAGGLRVLANR